MRYDCLFCAITCQEATYQHRGEAANSQSEGKCDIRNNYLGCWTCSTCTECIAAHTFPDEVWVFFVLQHIKKQHMNTKESPKNRQSEGKDNILSYFRISDMQHWNRMYCCSHEHFFAAHTSQCIKTTLVQHMCVCILVWVVRTFSKGRPCWIKCLYPVGASCAVHLNIELPNEHLTNQTKKWPVVLCSPILVKR